MAVTLQGRRALVSGASSGIGAACARSLAAAGADLVLLARRRQRLAALAEEITGEHGVAVRADQVDVRDRGAVEAWFAGLDGPWQEIDILVNNAGLARGLAPLHLGQVADWEEMIDVNVKGLLYVTRVVLEGMVRRGTGHVINISSVAGHEVYPGGNVYCATKHAVTALTRSMGIDLLESGIRVSSVDPGMVETEFALVRFHGDQERADAVYQGLTPLTAEDVADAVLFCATRPPHANVREMVLLPSAQASAVHAHRRR
jgi:serine 3-dehydrogenase